MLELEKKLSRFGYWYILKENRSGQNIVVSDNESDIVPVQTIDGVIAAVHSGDRIVEVASDNLEYLKSFDWQRLDNAGGEIDEKQADLELTIPQKQNFFETPAAERILLARNIWQKIKKSSSKIAFLKVIITHNELTGQFTSAKKNLLQKIPRTGVIFSAIFYDKGKQKMIFGGIEEQGGLEVIEKFEYKERIADGERLLDAERMKPGVYNTLFSPEFSGIFAHEAFGHGTEADLFEKDRSAAHKYLGKQVASPLVNLYDSPSFPSAAASFLFDDEGEVASPTKIIDNGILVKALTNLDAYLHNDDILRTANGRRENLFHKAYARMTNTYFDKGESRVDDMISSVDDGFMLMFPTNGMEDPKGWGIQLEGLAAKEIKDGKLTGKLFSPVMVTGFVPDLLKSVSMVSDLMRIDGLGYCGKGEKEIVKVTDGGPYLKLKAKIS